ncbi:MAG: signal transduction protein, partial [Deltaproteobacteria bacterium]|nr:signal transduction protein [Deltaproteobacteria bacterium]
ALDAATRIIKEAGGKILNVALVSTKGRQRAYCVRLEKCDLDPITKALEQAGIKVKDVIP